MKYIIIMLLLIQTLILCAFENITNAQTINLNISQEYAHNANNFIVKINFEVPNNYYIYAHEQTDSGKPTILKIIQNKFDHNALIIKYPAGQIRKDIFDSNKNIYAYTGKTAIFVELPNSTKLKQYDFILEMLLCSKAHCMPLSSKISVTLPSTTENIENVSWVNQFKQAKPSLNNQFITDDNFVASEITPLPTIPLSTNNLSSPAPIPHIPIIPAQDTWTFSPQYFQSYLEVISLGKAILLGLLAGLILNFMPCVLPVLTIKASALLLIKDEDKHVQYAKFREHNLLFAAGIITLFIILAILLSSAGLMWGQLFQKTQFVLIMLTIVFLLGLSMLGIFTLPMIDLKASSNSHPRLQAYTAGLITTLLATPCSAPLLGGVLAWAFIQPSAIIIIVFISVGCGMSLPYLIFSAKPQLVKYLPKPGAWIGILEKIVGFFLLATCLYLLSILPEFYYIPTLILLLAIALSAWIYGKFASYDATALRRRCISIFCLVFIGITAFFSFANIGDTSSWEEFNPQTFKQILGKERILLEFTADWCPNCKLLEKTTLTSKNLSTWQKQYKLRLIQVDLSQENIEGQKLLKALGSHSIPLTAIFPEGNLSAKPLVLRDIYSYKLINDALAKAFTIKSD